MRFPSDGMVTPNLLAKPVLLELEGVMGHTLAVGNRKFWGRDVPATKMLQGIRPWILGNSGELSVYSIHIRNYLGFKAVRSSGSEWSLHILE